ncbi:MAG: Xaa-Pro aminopeptidase [Deltaproteobacteria bacterium]|nr:Xaa-Pro aminopeptidase [Deltaproteobacteria bacterium]
MEAMGEGAIALIQGARLVTRSNDTNFPFRQDSDFHYLTGFDHPHATALLRTDGGPAYTLFVEARDPEMETWNGFRPGVERALADYEADEAHPNTELLDKLPELLRDAKQIHHTLGRDRALDERMLDTLEEMRLRSRRGQNPASQFVDPRAVLHEMRLCKEPGEVAIMERAAAITHEAHREAARLAHGGHNEYELEAVLDYTFRRRGAAGPAYASIVGGGANATILHYVQNDQPLVDGELLLIDAACELEGYASDVTRTYPIGGSFEGVRRDIYEAVLAAQKASLETAKPGTTLEEIHKASVRVLCEAMVELKLLEGPASARMQDEGFRRYYMHGTSHWLGLDVHDVGLYTVDGKARSLEPGMAFTIEPGLYIPADDEQAPEGLRGIGVRIEDDVVLTEEGHLNLTAAIPKEAADVEAWVREGTPS